MASPKKVMKWYVLSYGSCVAFSLCLPMSFLFWCLVLGREEEVMIMALHDTVASGWRADNSDPISTWKRDYHSLSLILSRSRIGFNSDGRHRIECNDEQWAQIVKACLRELYPHYTRAIFGESGTKSVPSPMASKKAIRKRKPEGVLESMLEAMTKMNEDTSECLKILSTPFRYNFNLSAKRVEVTKLLDGIPEITKKQKFMA
ncbi:hypothetical protein SASPL_152654 [Salvia splendens]|uniref:Uncharacterized protein n=1 Tax=Salvia splendens TaxID=180675 RepID=A0A8X8Z149_SALSN|nr:hypothetical protein SASPL_152654 [Salvia splendens]